MRSLLFTLPTLSPVAAFAHPKDSDPLYSIGVSAKIKFTSDINVTAWKNLILWRQGQIIETNEYGGSPPLVLLYLSARSDHDRVIPAGTELTISKIQHGRVIYSSTGLNGIDTDLRFISPQLNALGCRGVRENGCTVGDLKHALRGYAELVLSEPEIIDRY